MSIPVRCAGCGKGWSAPVDVAGKVIKCPACNADMQVAVRISAPPVATIRAPGVIAPSILPSAPVNSTGANRQSVGISQIVYWLIVAWGIALSVTFATVLVWLNAGITATILLSVVITAGFLALAGDNFRAKKRASKHGTAGALFGLILVAAWDPTEGVLFLKDKKLDFVDSNPNDGGGIRVILPKFAVYRLRCRPPSIQTTM